MSYRALRLGVNIDHVATIRNARGGRHPDPMRAAVMAVDAGADGITAHLREDRRHISDDDIERLVREVHKPLNLEMAATGEMLEIALRHKPHAVCLVPEKREEITTEGGLDAAGGHNHLAPIIRELVGAKIRVSLFIEASALQITAARSLGSHVVELHTGAYCDAHAHGDLDRRDEILRQLRVGAREAAKLGLEVHAGTWSELRDGGTGGRHHRSGRTQHRAFFGGRGDLHRVRTFHPAHAATYGRSSRWCVRDDGLKERRA